jgi:type IV pilus assembly protein PilM
MAFGAAPSVGLDIGTSAVRAAHVAGGRGGRSLLRFGQVALPSGAVENGEIRDSGAVSEAIAQLWKRAKFRTKRAVVGVANQRVVVRQIDIPHLDEKELRESLRFQVADHIPMPVEDAELDFQVVEDYVTEEGEHMLRLLLVAAARDMLETFVATANAGGVEPAGVDLTPFAAARAVSPAARGEVGVSGAEAIVDMGAGVTNIVVHVGGEARFVRILLVGGNDATEALAGALDLSFEEAEATKLDLGGQVGSEQARRVLSERVDELVGEIRGSIDYYLSQEDSEPISSVIVTGGASLTAGLMQRLQQMLALDVHRGQPLSELNVSKSGLTQEQVAHVEPVAAAAVGLALGATTK